jgi:FkbM family methyltransferase
VKNPLLKRLSRRARGKFWSARSLAAHGIAIIAETKNGVLAVQAGDFNVSRSLLVNGEYDWPQITWLFNLVDANTQMIFVGAHIGSVLVPLVRSTTSRRVLAFEPSPRNFRLLTMNLRLNNLDGVSARNAALGEAAGKIRFTENTINTGNSRIAPADGEIEVDIETLDHVLPAQWNGVDLIVMDIEGSEVAAMRGASSTLAKTRHLYVEFAPEQLREQGSSADEFVDVVERYFKSAYIFGDPVVFLPPGAYAAHLRAFRHSRSLLLNVLFTQDLQANPKLLLGVPPTSGS